MATKLTASQGTIYKQEKVVLPNLSLMFKRAALAPNGDMGEVYMESDGTQIIITYAQAVSLANVILARCQ